MAKRPLATVEDCDREIERIDRSMEALQTLLHLKVGDVLTQQHLDDLLFLDEYHRSEEDTALNTFSEGFDAGVKRAAGVETAKLIEERDAARASASVANAMRTSGEYHAFRDGAQACREMMARFVEQGGDGVSGIYAVIAASIRANWRPSWGDDPGRPAEERYANAKPREISAKPLDSASADRSGEADETSTKIEGSAEGESAVGAAETPNLPPETSNASD
jgi:hypothetical protein